MAGTLLAGGLACAVGAIVASRVDVGALIAQRIAGARGAVSAETAAALNSVSFVAWLGGAAAALLALAWVAWRTRPRWHTWLAGETPAPTKLALVALAVAAVLLRWPQTLTQGFFRYDDFDLLSVAQNHPWWQAIWLPHGDHVFPLTRVPAAIGLALFGTTAWPYNLGVLACMAGMIALGCLLLNAWRVARGAQFLFVALVVFWSPWGELMAGYYILSSYTLIAAGGLAVAWAWLRWRETRQARFVWVASGATLVATLTDISGWYVPCVFGVFLAADFLGEEKPFSLRAWFAAHRAMIGGVASATAVGLAGMVYAYAVVNRGLFLSMGGGQGRSLLRLAADFFYLVDVGLLGSMAVPFVYARLPVALLGALAVAVFALGAWFVVRALKHATSAQRFTLGALAAVVAGIALMVALGRPSEGSLAVRWAAKHVGPAYVWLCLLIAFAWHLLWMRAEARARALLAETTVAGLVVFCAAQFAFGRLGLAVAFPPFGYAAELRDAGVRRAAIEELRTQLLPAIQRGAVGRPITVPTLDGPYLGERWPSLFDYNLVTYAPFFGDELRGITLVRTDAMHPWPAPGVATVPSLRDAVSPTFRELLRHDETVRKFYLAHPVLRTRTAMFLGQGPTRHEDINSVPFVVGRALVPEIGSTLEVHRESFNSEATPRLQFLVSAQKAQPLRLEVTFDGDFSNAENRGALVFISTDGSVVEADLRQLYAFALSRQVSNLRLKFVDPGDGQCHIRATLLPPLSSQSAVMK